MRSTLGRSARHTLWRLVLWYLSAGLIGWTLGRFWLALAIASTALVVWQYLRLWLTLDAVNSRRWIHVDEGEGLWAELVAVLSRSQRESRQRKRRLLDLVRAYRQTIAALPDGTVILDPGLRIQWFNEAATRLLNLQHPQDVGRLFTHLVRTPRIVDWLEQRSEEPLLEVSTAANPTVQLSLRLIPYADGQWLLVVRDISKLTHLEQVRRDFVANVSHELRTPLTVIRVASDLMQGDPDLPERLQRSIGRIQRAGRDMEEVIDAFLILARESEVEPQREDFDVRDVVYEQVEQARPLLAGKPVELHVVEAGSPRLHASPRVLSVMVGNLLRNACTFTEKGRVDVRIDSDRIVIQDTGIGMTDEILKRAYDPFYRADTGNPSGKGMGLSIVRRLGERFGWPVNIESAPGHGTMVVIRFDA